MRPGARRHDGREGRRGDRPRRRGQLDIAAIIAHVREQIADFKVPQYVSLRSEPLPRNPGGKVLKAQLKDETEWGEPLR